MDRNTRNKLIIVEGLTGSGKSIMAHMVARQLEKNSIKVNWVHEGKDPHPVLMDVESSIKDFMQESLEKWKAFVRQIESSGEVAVVEACFYNNLIESLFTHNVEKPRIIAYSRELEQVIEAIHPALVYFTQSNVPKTLERNFENRGQGFTDYVIQYATGTPYAQQRGLAGYAGMMSFWQGFVALTDELFQEFKFKKLAIDNSAGDWDCYNRQVLEFLSIPLVAEPSVSESKARKFIGSYKDEKSGKRFIVQYENGALVINLFGDVRTRLVPKVENVFYAEGWYWEICFEKDDLGNVRKMEFGGRDIDYLSLVGTTAVKELT